MAVARAPDAMPSYKQSMEEFHKMAKHPLVKECDMAAEMKEEAVDIAITAVEKFPAEREKCTQVLRRSALVRLPPPSASRACCGTASERSRRDAQLIKDTMDKKFGPAWHVVVGKGFSYDVQYEVRRRVLLGRSGPRSPGLHFLLHRPWHAGKEPAVPLGGRRHGRVALEAVRRPVLPSGCAYQAAARFPSLQDIGLAGGAQIRHRPMPSRAHRRPARVRTSVPGWLPPRVRAVSRDVCPACIVPLQ